MDQKVTYLFDIYKMATLNLRENPNEMRSREGEGGGEEALVTF